MQAKLDSQGRLPEHLWPDISALVTEDDTPVESWYQERQMALLGDTLTLSWKGPGDGRTFLVGTDMGVFDNPRAVTVVPDVVLGLDVEAPQEDLSSKHDRSWFVWRFGPPFLAMEIVSNRKGEEEQKLPEYARLGVRYVVIWDPYRYLGKRRLRIYRLVGREYKLLRGRTLPELGLGLAAWTGTFQGLQKTWLRWHTIDGDWLPTAEEEKQRADEAEQRAYGEKRRADEQKQRAERLAERLRQLGVDPDLG